MSDTLDIGLIGLGVMGQRMLARLAQHPRLRATRVWDADPAALARTLAAFPDLQAATSAEALIATPGLHTLYIATPPAPHMALSNRAFDAGLAVFCEKPLTVDFDAARRTIASRSSGDIHGAMRSVRATSDSTSAANGGPTPSAVSCSSIAYRRSRRVRRCASSNRPARSHALRPS